jgi:hypothetical protein
MYRRAIALAAALLAGVALVGVAPDALSGRRLAELSLFPAPLALRGTLGSTTHVGRVSPEHFTAWLAAEATNTAWATRDQFLRRLVTVAHELLPASELLRYPAEELAALLATPRPLTEAEERVKSQVAKEAAAKSGENSAESDEYWHFIPEVKGKVVADAPLTFSTDCWGKVELTFEEAAEQVTLHVRVSQHQHLMCADLLLFATGSGHFHWSDFPAPVPGTKTFAFSKKDLTESDLWDLRTLGIRCFRFHKPMLQTVHAIMSTALMFEPLLQQGVSDFAARRNADFLKRYRLVDFPERSNPPEGVAQPVLNESEIHAGDFLGIIRMDGLDTMLAWGMGSTTGHTVVVMEEDGQKYVAESQSGGNYWKANGIQRTPYREWLALASKAGYNVVHAPLAPKYREIAQHNLAKMNAYFHSQEGQDYGYQTMLYSWIDVREDNYVCLPPYGEGAPCLKWEVVEILFPLVGRLVPAANEMWLPAWNAFVTGNATAGLSVTQLYQMVHTKGGNIGDIPTGITRDGQLYPQRYNNGTQTVGERVSCDVFVCNVWKHAGLFGETPVNCGEFTNTDVYTLEFLQAQSPRPPQCVAADPDNNLCQLLGKYSFTLPKMGTQSPYPHMNEHCPGFPPNYTRPAGC